jgi:hypothetical protein
MKLKIKVTKEILERSAMCGYRDGGPDNIIGQNCAIALAVREIFPTAQVCSNFIRERWVPGTLEYCLDNPEQTPECGWFIPLPENAKKFIRAFDIYGPSIRTSLPEIEFEITLTDEVLATINIDQVKEILKSSTTLELV